jgi:hypothetical protein
MLAPGKFCTAPTYPETNLRRLSEYIEPVLILWSAEIEQEFYIEEVV